MWWMLLNGWELESSVFTSTGWSCAYGKLWGGCMWVHLGCWWGKLADRRDYILGTHIRTDSVKKHKKRLESKPPKASSRLSPQVRQTITIFLFPRSGPGLASLWIPLKGCMTGLIFLSLKILVADRCVIIGCSFIQVWWSSENGRKKNPGQ